MWSEQKVQQLESDNRNFSNAAIKEHSAIYQDYSNIPSIIAPKLGLRLRKTETTSEVKFE